jgi:hypothetical protein
MSAAKVGAGRAIAVALAVGMALPRWAAGQPSLDGGLAAMTPAVDGGTGEAMDGGTAAPDAGPFADPLYSQCPPNDPTQPATQDADGSWRLPPVRAARQACLLTTCNERRLQLEAAPPPLGSTSLIFAAIVMVIGFGLGGYLGWTVARWLPR